MSFSLSNRSKQNLKGVHPDLQAVVYRAIKISPIDFAVTEGVRSVEKQKLLFDSGASQTMRSRHLDGHAVDLAAWVGGEVRWDWTLYDILNVAMKQAAAELGIPLEWGGDFVTWKDGPHWQLPWKDYR